jgi:hypothetical protein
VTDLPRWWQPDSIRRALDLPTSTTRLVDLRLVLDRTDTIRVYIEGRRIEGVPQTSDVSIVLAHLARVRTLDALVRHE